MMTQVKLRIQEGDRTLWTVGFVETKFAVQGAQLDIGKRTWEVHEVWGTQPKKLVAWWYKAQLRE